MPGRLPPALPAPLDMKGRVRYFPYMSKLITKRFRAAVRETVVSVGALAEESGYSAVTWDTYVNRRSPSREATLALADALERRARRLAVHAERLREAVEDDPGGVGPRV